MPSDSAPPKTVFTYAPGSTPLDRYTIRRGIGVGGFGEVYFAISEAGKEVALKRIQRNLEVELRGVSHCLNLKHANLVALYDICRDEGDQAWVVMEYVAGPNLRQVLDDAPGGMPEAEVRRWFTAIANGVGHLHAAGLVHRDLKPGNVFDDLGIIKVGDYGLSKFISASHKGGHTESVGTFHYMAPEIGRGEYGREIDIYALGVILYEMLTGRVPFDGESCHEIIVKHLTATPELGDVPEPYRQVIRAALSKDPKRRPGSTAEMLAMLGADGADPPPPEISGRDPQATVVSEPCEPNLPDASSRRENVAASPVAAKRPRDRCTHGPPAAAAGRLASIRPTPVDEPLARAVKHSVADLKSWWRTLDRSPGAKAFLAIAAGIVLVINTHWLLPLLSLVAVVYVPYYVIRHMVLHVRQQPSYAEAQRIASSRGGVSKPVSRAQWRRQVRSGLRAKRSLHRVAELSTSWVVTTITTLVLVTVAAVIGLRSGPVDALALALYGWIAAVVLASSLGLLGLGKLWERGEGEGLTRRLVLTGLGAAVGAAAFASHEFLLLPIEGPIAREVDATTLPQALYAADGTPRGAALMAHFALLFAALRWWKPVDPLRRTRLSLWAVAVAVVAEWGIHQLLPIPQPAGYLIAGGIAIAVQMSAPWINPRPDEDETLVAAPRNGGSVA